MNNSIRTVLLGSLLATVSEAGSGNGVTIPRAGIDTFLDSVTAESLTHGPTVTMPDSSASISGVKIDVKNMRVDTLERPTVTYRLENASTVLATVSLPKTVVKGAANTERKTFVSTQKDAGFFVLTLNNLVVEVPLAVRKFENGVLTLQGLDCKPTAGPSNLGLQEFREKFSTEVMTLNAKTLQSIAVSRVCPTIQQMLRPATNRALGALPVVFDFSKPPSVGAGITLALTQEQLQVTTPAP